MTVDVPPGASVESIQIPGLPAPVAVDHRPRPGRDADARRRRRPPTPDPRDARPARTPPPTSTPPVGRRPRPAAAGDGRRRRRPPTPARGDKGGEQEAAASATAAVGDRPSALDPNAEALDGELERARQGDAPRRASTDPQPDAQHRRLADARQPDRLARDARRRAASASRTSSSRSSASRRSCCRSTRPPASSTACAGRCWPRSTRSRPTTAATSTSPPPARSGWMQFMPATWETYGVDGNQRRPQGPVQPGRRDLRRRALPASAAGADKDLRARDLRLQPRRLVRRLGPPARALIGGLPADLVGSLSGLTQGRFPVAGQGDLRRASVTRKDVAAAEEGRTPPTSSSRARGATASGSSPRAGAPVVAVNDGRIVRIGPQPPARQLRPAAGRLRQHVHVRAPEDGRRALPDAEAADGRRARGPRELAAADARRRARPARPPVTTAGRGAQARKRRARRAPRAQGRAARAARRRAGEGAPVRQPRPPERRGRRRRRSSPTTRSERLRQLPQPASSASTAPTST